LNCLKERGRKKEEGNIVEEITKEGNQIQGEDVVSESKIIT
jgi:hypothetical protein